MKKTTIICDRCGDDCKMSHIIYLSSPKMPVKERKAPFKLWESDICCQCLKDFKEWAQVK